MRRAHRHVCDRQQSVRCAVWNYGCQSHLQHFERISRVSWAGASWHACVLLEGRGRTLECMCNMQSTHTCTWKCIGHSDRTSIVILRGCSLIAPLMPFHIVYLLAQPFTMSLSKYRASKKARVCPITAPTKTMGMPEKEYTAPPARVRMEEGKNTAAHSTRLQRPQLTELHNTPLLQKLPDILC